MPQISFYFHLHQPLRLGDFDLFDLGSKSPDYFASKSQTNKKIFQKVAQKSYLPMLGLLKKLLTKYPDFRVALSASGIFLEQAKNFEPQVIKLLQVLAKTGRVEFLAETYYHSLASLYSKAEFNFQVEKQVLLLEDLFNQTPISFRNTELVYSNQIAQLVSQLGFAGILTEAVPRYMNESRKTQLHQSLGERPLPLMLKHAQLSDDIAFRFSQQSWEEYPITAPKYYHWLSQYGDDDHINLFMDFETFGEHQWADTGIFLFFAELIKLINNDKNFEFVLPREVFLKIKTKNLTKLPIYDVPEPISWADIDRDLTAWLANPLQQDTINKLYNLETSLIRLADQELLEIWRYLQCSDHFYYMCTKWSADGDVHAYFSHYDSPLEAYRKFSIVLSDFIDRVKKKL